MPRDSLPVLAREVIRCRACPRLVAWREEVARVRRRAYADQTYWGRPVPGFGDPDARILVLGLAPGAHGANRTGRVFTGDRSGDFLYAALHRAGLASQPTSTARDDGLTLRHAYVTLPVRCVPPDNRPAPDEIARCAPFLHRELTLLTRVRVVMALGAVAWSAYLDHLAVTGVTFKPRPSFAHGAELAIAKRPTLLASYHVSQQNTQTGRLTPAMFDAVLARAKELARIRPDPGVSLRGHHEKR